MRLKRPYAIWFHLCEIPLTGKSMETENRFVVVYGWGIEECKLRQKVVLLCNFKQYFLQKSLGVIFFETLFSIFILYDCKVWQGKME